jgi:branched-chain amino acid transport system permease protein
MVAFSALLMGVVLFRQRGLMGNREFSWAMLSRARVLPRKGGPAGSGGGTHGVA